MAEDGRDVEHLRALLHVSRLVGAGVRGENLYAAIADAVARAFGFTVVLNLHRPVENDFEAVVVQGNDDARETLLGAITTDEIWQALLDPRFEVGGCCFVPAGSSDRADHPRPALVPDIEPVAHENAWLAEDALLVPLRQSDGHLLGVLSLDEPVDGMRPQPSDLGVLASLGAHLAQALESATATEARELMISELEEAERTARRQSQKLQRTLRERTRELELARVETLQRLALAAEYRDDDTHQHTERVGALAAMLARGIGLSRAEVAVIRRAAPLHDIGKLGVPDAILLKRGSLSAREQKAMQAHTIIGARILAGSQSQVLRVGEEIALTHHERWDGHGYPRGIAAESIPISGRLTTLADVFDALTHTRPYKDVWPLQEAVDEIARLSDSYFDPRIVEVFLALDHELLAGLRFGPKPELATPR
jgi:putative nucleotidyltransferase with HDIG domain